ncbi:MAG: acyl-ACP--UDP-N-acetylglucosamine O-acyltransferase [Alphaproteobacteria bacterium]|nr:acyl-ACP--UDP-N-acetylglucosamine O-acyltransferase [Alphaproteobacteria bacterium]
MISTIHPTAIIEPGVQIGAGVRVGAYSIIGAHVVLGDNVIIHPHVIVTGHTTVGAGTQIYSFSSIGNPPQDLKYHGEASRLVIGERNVIREHVTMNTGTEGGGMETRIGNNGLFMAGAHVAHDCQVGNNVIMANQVAIAGHVVLGDHVVIGGLSAVHQFVRIGEHAMIGGMTGVENDVIPFGRVKGERGFLAGLNLIGLERRGFTKDQIKSLQRAFNQLFGDEGTLEQRLEAVETDFANEALVMDLVQFARAKTRFPLCQPPKKAA